MFLFFMMRKTDILHHFYFLILQNMKESQISYILHIYLHENRNGCPGR